MYKVNIFSIGKTKELWLQEALNEYTKRLKPVASIMWTLAKNDKQLLQHLEKSPSYIALDPNGKERSSEAFSTWLLTSLEKRGTEITFVIGGAEGLPKEIAKKSFETISLSKLTFTHQITRLVLLEQIYRAFEIKKNSGYHK